MIITAQLPQIKTFLRPARLSASTLALLVRLIAAFLYHPPGMSASCAAETIRAQARHRAQIARFLARCRWSKDWAVLNACAGLLLQTERQRGGSWLLLLDQTYCGQQGRLTENTFSTGHRGQRPKQRKDHRHKKKKRAARSCHCFVMGLVLSPSGLRLPCCRFYYTQDYCAQKKFRYRKQTELAAALIRDLVVPEGARVVVVGDTAFEAKDIRAACQERNFVWIVPINPERVLAGAKPRPQVQSLAKGLGAEHFQAVRLVPGQGAYAAQRRVARCRLGPKAKARTFYVHPERRPVHNVGDVLLVFSTKEQPQAGQPVSVQKILMTNGVNLSVAEVVELYDLRWQIELFFKELKSTLGFHRYRFRSFAKVEGWVQACLVTFCYLEWYRAQQLASRTLTERQRRWWQGQRSYGLARAVIEQVQEQDLAQLLRWTATKTGLGKLRHTLRQALPAEYRIPRKKPPKRVA